MIEPFAPEGAIDAHPIDERSQSLWPRAVMRFASLAPVAHQLGILQNAEVFGNGRLRYAGTIRQRMYGLLPIAGEVLEDGSTGRVGESLEDMFCCGLHFGIITTQLWVVKSQARPHFYGVSAGDASFRYLKGAGFDPAMCPDSTIPEIERES
jgi:hypothetical protein